MSLGITLRTPSHSTINWTRTIAVLVFAVVSLGFAVMSRAEPAPVGQAVASTMAQDHDGAYFNVSR